MNQERIIEVKELEHIAEKLEELVKKFIGTDFYEVRAKASMFKTEHYYNYVISIDIFRRYGEISEVCMHVESEEEFNECYESELNEINEEAAIYLNLEYTSRHARVEAWPLECRQDNCKVGFHIEVSLQTKAELSAENIYEVIRPVLDLAFVERELVTIETIKAAFF